MTGGNGGNGGNGGGGGGRVVGGTGGNGGNGGIGVGGNGFTLTNLGSITGGNGGNGGNGGYAGTLGSNGNGGNGGNGITGAGITLTNSGIIQGGNAGTGGNNGTAGVGVESAGNARIVNNGAILGGLSANGSTRAAAVVFSGGNNILTLEAGYSFSGNVVSTSGSTNRGDTLALGGDVSPNSAFDLSNVVTSMPASPATGTTYYAGFNQFAKTGASTWIVTGSTASTTPWTISGGTLQVGDASNNGVLTGNITNDAALVFDNATASSYGGAISGSGTLTKQGQGILTLTGVNTYGGSTMINSGTLEVTAGASVGTGSVTVDNTLGQAAELKVDSGATLANHIVLNNGATLDNAGTLTAASVPHAVESNSGMASVTNHAGGSINGALGEAIALSHGGTITNSGAGTIISDTSTGTAAVLIAGTAGSVTNTDGAVITATYTGINLAPGGVVTNSGAGSRIISATDNAVFIAGGAGTVINGSGATISGFKNGVDLTDGGTLANAGNIVGGVSMDASTANSVTLTAGGSITGNLAIGTNASSTLTLNGAAGSSQLYSQAVTGTTTFDGALTANGAGTWIIDSNDLSSVTGTTIAAGTLQLGNGNATGSVGNGNVTDNGTLAFDYNVATSFSNNVSGSGALQQDGSGTITLSNPNTYSGGTYINAGELDVGNNLALGTGTVTMAAGSTLGFAANGLALTNAFALNGNASINVASGNTATLSGGLSDGNAPGALTLNPGGTLVLPSNETYTGATTVASGATLALPNYGDIATSSLVTVDGTLDMSQTNWQGGWIKGLAGSGTVVLNPGTSTSGDFNLVINSPNGATFSGVIEDAPGATTNIEGGVNVFLSTETFTGANTYNGGTQIFSGTLALAGTGSIADSSQVSVYAGGNFDISGTTHGASIVSLASGGNVALGDQALTLTGANDTFGGIISDGGATTGSGGQLIVAGGRETLTGINTYTGATTIDAGATLALSGTGSIASSSGVTDNGTLDVSANGATIANLAGGGNVLFGGQALTLANASGTFAGAFSGSGTLNKNGSGLLVLDGNSSGFAGSTTVNSGALEVGDAATPGAILGGNVAVASGGTLRGHGSIGGNVDLQAGGILAPGGSIGTLTVNGSFTAAQGSELDFELGAPGANFHSMGTGDSVHVGGNLALDGATLNVSNAGGMGPGIYNLFSYGGTLTETNGGLALGSVPAGQSLFVQNLTGQKQINLVNSTGYTLNFWNANGLASATRMGGGSGTWSASSQEWTNATGTAPNGPMSPNSFAIFGGTAGTVTVDTSVGPVNATGMQFASNGYALTGGTVDLLPTTHGSSTSAPIIDVGDGSSASAGWTATIASQLRSSDGFAKTGAGTLVMATVQSNLGGTVAVQGGTLQVGDGQSPTGLMAPITLASGTRLVLDNGGALGVGGPAAPAAVSGSDFSVMLETVGSGGASAIIGSSGEIALQGTGFTAAINGQSYIEAGSGSGSSRLGGAGSAAIAGSGFQVANSNSGKAFGNTPTGILGGTGGTGGTLGGSGGAGISGTGFTIQNQGDIYGGTGGSTVSGTGGTGGAGIDGAGFTLTNAGTIQGGEGGSFSATGGIGGLGGTGVASTGDANVVTSGAIAGGLNGAQGAGKVGTTLADAVAFSGGGNMLTLENGYSFTGNVVSTSGTTQGGDTLALGGNANGTFDVSNIVAALPAGATGTQYTGFNAFTKTGSSTWTLSGNGGNNGSANENWNIGSGTLALTSAANIASTSSIADNATLDIGGSTGGADIASLSGNGAVALGSQMLTLAHASGNFAGVIGGSGGLTMTSGTETLSGANTYTGATTINAGTLQLGNGGTTGSIAGNVADNGTLAFDRSDATSFAGVVSGTGALVQNGSGTLTLSGANSYTGGTAINAGTLAGDASSLQGAIADNAALVFDQAGAGTFAGTLTGHGSIAMNGSGLLVLDGNSGSFAGNTTVNSGTLEVGDADTPSAVLGGNVAVAGSGTLRGHGSIGGNVSNGGTLWAGGSIGTLTVQGNYTQAADGVFEIEAAPTGQASLLNVGGSASLAGTALVLADTGNWAPRTNYTVLTATGGVSGQFASASSSLAFLNPVLSYGANAVTLSLERNDISFSAVAQTPNQAAVAGALNPLGYANPLYSAVVTLDAATARQAFGQLAGEIHASTRTAIADNDHYVRDAIGQHLAGQHNNANGLSVTDADGVSAWTATWGHWGSHDGNGNASTLADNGSGLLLGVDMPVGGAARLGAVLGTGQGSARIAALGASSHVIDQHLGLYGSAQTGALLWQGAAIYGWQKVDTNRPIDFGTFSGTAVSSYHAHTAQAYVDGSLPFALGHTTLAPFANLAVEQLGTPAIAENGTPAALDVASQDSTVGYGTLGLRASFDLGAPNHGLHAHASLGWQHAWGDTLPIDTMRFQSGGDSFAIAGLPVLRNAGVFSTGISFTVAPNVSVDGSYQGQFGKHAADQAARISLDWKF